MCARIQSSYGWIAYYRRLLQPLLDKVLIARHQKPEHLQLKPLILGCIPLLFHKPDKDLITQCLRSLEEYRSVLVNSRNSHLYYNTAVGIETVFCDLTPENIDHIISNSFDPSRLDQLSDLEILATMSQHVGKCTAGLGDNPGCPVDNLDFYFVLDRRWIDKMPTNQTIAPLHVPNIIHAVGSPEGLRKALEPDTITIKVPLTTSWEGLTFPMAQYEYRIVSHNILYLHLLNFMADYSQHVEMPQDTSSTQSMANGTPYDPLLTPHPASLYAYNWLKWFDPILVANSTYDIW
jgi:hypothetical protein